MDSSAGWAGLDNWSFPPSFQPTSDCSDCDCRIWPLCSVDCYHRCINFDSDSDSDSSDHRSTNTVAIFLIVVLVTAFTVFTIFLVIIIGRRRRPQSSEPAAQRQDASTFTVNEGLDESVIRSIAVCKYRKGEGPLDATDCAVCLAEFKEDESLRRLPKCGHAFHTPCIDAWFKSHSSCPLCRAIVDAAAAVEQTAIDVEDAAGEAEQDDGPNAATSAGSGGGGGGEGQSSR